MPKNNVSDPITDQEIAYAHLLMSGTMNDRSAAEAAGLNPDTAAYTKAKPRVRDYMAQHRAAVGQDGPLAFFAHAQWRPPAGWYVWIVLVIIAAGSLAATAWLARDGGDRRLPAG